MATTPTWQGATSGQLPKAAQVNQFLGSHQTQLLYSSLRKAAQDVAGSGSVNTNGLYLAQSFTTAVGQTTIGYVQLDMTTTGGLASVLPPTTLSLYANSAGAPTGAALITTALAAEYVASSISTTITIPLPITGLTASTTYWLVLTPAGDASHFFNWNKSNQVSGASTSANGTVWAAQAFGLLYQVWDQTISAPQVISIWEDSGARWTWFGYSGNTPITIAEYTAGQTVTATSYTQSYRNLTFSGSAITSIT